MVRRSVLVQSARISGRNLAKTLSAPARTEELGAFSISLMEVQTLDPASIASR